MVEEIVLRDGRAVTIRPVGPDDAARLGDLHARCSDDSRYFRFHSAKPRLRAAEAEYLAGADGAARVALVATIVESGEERIVADARFDVLRPGEAETALLLRDDFQGGGLGTLLAERLIAIAAHLGHQRLLFDVLLENKGMLALAQHFGARAVSTDGCSVLLALDLVPAPAGV